MAAQIQSTSLPPRQRDNPRALRGLFSVLIGFLLLVYCGAVVQQWHQALHNARTALVYMRSILVQSTRATLTNHELILRGLGSELVAQGALSEPERGRDLIERMKSIDPGTAGFGLARPDGRLVLVSGVPADRALPNLLQISQSREGFQKSIATRHIQPGRPYYFEVLHRWVVPVRVPIYGKGGGLVAVMASGYGIEGGTAQWAHSDLPQGTHAFLLRDDGYFQYFHPLPPGPREQVLESYYGKPVGRGILRQLAGVRGSSKLTPPAGLREGDEAHYVAFARIPEYGLLAAVITPVRAVLLKWVQRLVVPTLLLLGFLVVSLWTYQRSLARQRDSDAAVMQLSAWQQAVLDGAEYSIISTDRQGVIVSFNAAARRMLGYTPEAVLGRMNAERLHDPAELADRAAELSTELGQALAPGFDVLVAEARLGRADEREWIYVRADGSRLPVRLSVTALRGADGSISGFMGIAADVSEHRKAKADLRDSEARYRTLFEGAGDSIFLIQDEHFVDCNPASLGMFACTREQMVGATPLRYSPQQQPDGSSSRTLLGQHMSAAFRGEKQNFEWRHLRHDGAPFDTEVSLSLVEIAGAPHLLSTVRDISERKEAEAELARSQSALIKRNESLDLINQLAGRLHGSLDMEEILQESVAALRGLSHAPHVAIYLMEPNGDRLRLAASHGFDREMLQTGETLPLHGSLSGLALASGGPLVTQDVATDDRVEPRVRAALAAAGIRSGVVLPMIDHDKQLGSINLVYAEHRGFAAVELETLVAFSNTLALATINARHVVSLAYQARHDSLTGLPNRSLLHETFGEHLVAAEAEGAHPALMLLDLERFKDVNDTLGHHVGDKLLAQIGPRLAHSLEGQRALVCRLGGDEFAVLISPVGGGEQAWAIAQDLVEAIQRPFLVEGMALQIGATVGLAHYPDHGSDSHALLRAADVAMYQAKQGACGVAVYDRSLDSHSPARLALAAELVGSISGDQLLLHYQPKVELSSRRIVGFEALVRWHHPRLGLLLPEAFMQLAEMSDIIHDFTRRVMDLALTQIGQLEALGHPQPVAVNLSARNLRDTRFVAQLAQAMESHGVPWSRMELELTETALMHDPDYATALLDQLASMGVRIAVDDFGTGYSSLAYLRRLPIHALKIDRSFVMDMPDNPQDTIIVRSTIDLAHNLGLKVIAEGVESARVVELLTEMGCDEAQGYHLCRPLPWDDLIPWLARA